MPELDVLIFASWSIYDSPRPDNPTSSSPVVQRTFRSREVNDVAIALEHVDLLDLLDGLNIQFLEVCLQLLVVGAGCLVDLLDLTPRSTLASVSDIVLVFLSPHAFSPFYHSFSPC